MKVTALLGSPKKNGNTAAVLEMVGKELDAHGDSLEVLHMKDYNVSPCHGCYSCQKNPDAPGCVQDDDSKEIFDKMIQSDAIIYATPLYMWGFAAQLKALIDRQMCLVRGFMTSDHRSFIEDKPAALLVTCGGPVQNNTESIQNSFDALCSFLKTKERISQLTLK